MKLQLEQRFWIPAILALPILALTLVVAHQLLQGTQHPSKTPRKAAQPTALAQPFVSLSLEQAYNDLLQRPPFVPMRKYNPSTASGTAKTSIPKGQFVLVGITASNNIRVAWLRKTAAEKAIRVEEGQEIDGVRLEKVDMDKVILNQGGDREELRVKIQPRRRPAQEPITAEETPQSRPLPGNTATGSLPATTEPLRPPPVGGKPIPRPIER